MSMQKFAVEKWKNAVFSGGGKCAFASLVNASILARIILIKANIK